MVTPTPPFLTNVEDGVLTRSSDMRNSLGTELAYEQLKEGPAGIERDNYVKSTAYVNMKENENYKRPDQDLYSANIRRIN